MRLAKVAATTVATFVTVTGVAWAHSPLTAVGAGTSTTNTCAKSASVGYRTGYSAALSGYVLTHVPIDAETSCAHHHFELTLVDGRHHQVRVNGAFDRNGAADPGVARSQIDAATVAASLVITD